MELSFTSAVRDRLVPFVVAGALVAGVGAAGTVTLEQSRAAAPSSSVSVLVPAPVASSAAVAGSTGASTSANVSSNASSALAEQSWVRRALEAALRGIKGAGPAIRAGWTSFSRWFNGLPWYVKAPIRAISPVLTVYDIYMMVRDLF